MPSLLERDRELAHIAASLAQAGDGSGSCVVVEGPAGIGKTALLESVTDALAREGYAVLKAAGSELEIDFPFGVVRQLFPAVVDTTMAPLSFGLFESLHRLYVHTAEIAESRRVLIAVDDAHWCDGASLRFLLYLRRRLNGLPVTLLVAARPGEPGSEEQLLELLRDERHSTVVRPPGLSLDAITAMVAEAFGDAPDPDCAAAVYAATTGNPFLVGELINGLIDQGLPPTEGAVEQIAMIGPKGVQRTILHRLSRLGPGATALARAVAVLGGGAEVRYAVELSGLGAAEVSGLIEALVRVQILRDERVLTFAHPLVRAAIYADVPAAGRAQAHSTAAKILATGGADGDLIAAHVLEGAPGGDPAVVEYLRGAAARAAEHGATDAAVAYLRRALVEPPTPAQLPVVVRELGAAELAGGQPDAAADRLAKAATLVPVDDIDAQVGIVLMRRHALVLADRISEALTVVDGVAASREGPELSDLLVAAALGAGHLDSRVARNLGPRLTRLLARAAEPAVREPLTLAVAAAVNACANGRLATTVDLADRAIAALPSAHPRSDYTVEGQLSVALYVSERYDILLELASDWLADARRRGSLPRFMSMATVRSIAGYRAGSLADAEADARDALEAARLYGHQFWLPGAVAALVNPLVECGRYDEAEQLLVETQVEERHGQSSAFCWTAMFLPARAKLRLAQGRVREALADLLTCGERHGGDTNRSPSLWSWRSDAALALHTLGERERAEELVQAEVVLARELGTPRALGVALRAQGIVTGGAAGLGLLADAVDVLAQSPARLEHARALMDLGAAVRRSGRPGDARAPLREAEDIASRCGAQRLTSMCREELLASGARPRRNRLRGIEALTPSELRVARMAADGRTNPEIAQTLFLTRRTVETHLTHAFRKLCIESRGEIAAALAE
jgi:DNA-binding CsgD family transcriptional regulator/tetratricopeptide (TPR) repeat protein